MKEFELINKLFKPIVKKTDFAQNLLDDVAKISINNDEELIVSKDMICEDVHFYLKDGGFKIASKLLRVNLSDIASAGANPLCYILGVSKNSRCNEKFWQDFAKGLKSTQDQFNISLIGGDTISTKSKNDHLIFSLTIFGVAKKDKTLKRFNAKENDLIFVTGDIGDAFLGLKISQNNNIIKKFNFSQNQKEYLLNRHFFPEPRIELAKKLVEKNLSKCATDVSDGLLADILNICNSANLSAEIYLEQIPTFFSKYNDFSHQSTLVNKGDDYEIIFTSTKENLSDIEKLEKQLKLKITQIGKIVPYKNQAERINIFDNSTNKKKINFKKYGYQH